MLIIKLLIIISNKWNNYRQWIWKDHSHIVRILIKLSSHQLAINSSCPKNCYLNGYTTQPCIFKKIVW